MVRERLFKHPGPVLLAAALLLSSAPLALGARTSVAADASVDRAYVARSELHAAVAQWIAATNSKDLDAQLEFYPPRVQAFYLWRDTSREAVLAEKRRVFEQADIVDIRIETPQIVFEEREQSARMYFRKRYLIINERGEREGEVLQELRWKKHADGWKITSERDLRVLN